MAIITQSLLLDATAILVSLALIIITYFHYAYQYWKKKGVPYLEPKFPLGNTKYLTAKASFVGTLTKEFYDALKAKGHKFGGVYTITRPVLVLVDPEYIKDIMVKDFHHFVDRGFYNNEEVDPLSTHLFSSDETKWKNIRTKLTPTFTSGKMKMMFDSVVQCAGYMKEALDIHSENGDDIDIREILSCFTTDVIGSVAFGIECNSFTSPNAEFRTWGKRIFEIQGILHMARLFLIMNLPDLAKKLGVRFTRSDVTIFFRALIEKTIKYREQNNIIRKDFLQLLIEMKNDKAHSSEPLTMEQLSAQVFLFFVAGFDTSSSTMNFALYELARNPDIQEKLRSEIETVLANHGGNITYDSLNEMTYLGQVMNETLRLYPPLTTLSRKCTKDYQLRDTDIIIEKGTPVFISALGLHRDPQHYPNPEVFDPERFSLENMNERHHFVHIPFGEGPRNCIGLRFGWMQSKIGILTVINNFRISISPKTQMPLTLNPYVFLTKSNETLYLQAKQL